MVRLTMEVINDADQVVDPNNDRAIILRGLKIAVIENLGITRDQYGCIDLSDNEIVKISNIPKLTRLRTLLLANNSISRIANDAFEFIPRLTCLVLTHNKIAKLAVLLPLKDLLLLERVSLLDNPVVNEPYYRWFLIHLLNYSLHFRFIDFQRITQTERNQAKTFFDSDQGLAFLSQLVPEPTVPDIVVAEEKKPTLSPEILVLIGKALSESTDMEDLNMLEQALKSGQISDKVAARIGLAQPMHE